MFFQKLQDQLDQGADALTIGSWIKTVCYGREKGACAHSLSTIAISSVFKAGHQRVFDQRDKGLDLFFEDEQISTETVYQTLQHHFGALQGYWGREGAWVWHHDQLLTQIPETLPKPSYWTPWNAKLSKAFSFHEMLQPGRVRVEDVEMWTTRLGLVNAEEGLYRYHDHLLGFNHLYPRQRVVLARFV